MTSRPLIGKNRLILIAAGLAAVVGSVSLAYVATGGSGGQPAAAYSAHPATSPSGRVVRLSRTLPLPSTGTHLNAQLISGSVPAAGIEATVLADLDCTPDADGISHCHNPLRLADGRRAEIIHPHSMMVVPCLTQGEHVRLVWE
jgi:hypothetical protein